MTSRLRLHGEAFQADRFPLRFCRERDIHLLFMMPVSPSVKPATGQRRLRKKKAGRSSRTSGKPRAGQAKKSAGTKQHGASAVTLMPLKTAP
ncbi:MAG: hypothetical protein EA344_03510 [Alkalicoccus sp.]|nr:MAG: hypothetical protein EA344_03510 [Alkalicoccus sp.]